MEYAWTVGSTTPSRSALRIKWSSSSKHSGRLFRSDLFYVSSSIARRGGEDFLPREGEGEAESWRQKNTGEDRVIRGRIRGAAATEDQWEAAAFWNNVTPGQSWVTSPQEIVRSFVMYLSSSSPGCPSSSTLSVLDVSCTPCRCLVSPLSGARSNEMCIGGRCSVSP